LFLRILAWRAVNFLFSRFAIEVLVVGIGILSGMMDDTVPMIRRRIERIEFETVKELFNKTVIYYI
jgi:hypothetical protein